RGPCGGTVRRADSRRVIVAEDYYALLGIRRDASQAEIKSAYRRLARELHPDVNPDPETQEKFKEITQAYEVLGDAEKRQMYDLGGDPFAAAGAGGAGLGGVGRGGGVPARGSPPRRGGGGVRVRRVRRRGRLPVQRVRGRGVRRRGGRREPRSPLAR